MISRKVIIILLIGTFAVLLTSALLYNSKGLLNCNSGQIRYKQCGNACGNTCDEGQIWNCTKCVCPNNESKCGDTNCCPVGNCQTDKDTNNSFCCDNDQMCATSSDPSNCCPADKKCDGKGNCLEICPTQSGACALGEKCITVTGLSDASMNQFINTPDFASSAKCTQQADKSYTCSGCGVLNCETSIEKTAPAQISGFNPCTDIFTPNGDDIGYCMNTTSGTPSDCVGKSADSCETETGKCTFNSIFDSKLTIDQINSDIQTLRTVSGNPEYEGSWCGDSNFNYMIETSDVNGTCTYADCWNQLGHQTSRLNYSPDGICRGFGNCSNNNPKDFVLSKSCVDEKQPSQVCPAGSTTNTCTAGGDITKYDPDCPGGTCIGACVGTYGIMGAKNCYDTDPIVSSQTYQNYISNNTMCATLNTTAPLITDFYSYIKGAKCTGISPYSSVGTPDLNSCVTAGIQNCLKDHPASTPTPVDPGYSLCFTQPGLQNTYLEKSCKGIVDLSKQIQV